MKSVGEVMAIGRTFQESIQKALRGLEIGVDGFDEVLDKDNPETHAILKHELGVPGAQRIWYVADAFRLGYSLEQVHEVTRIDPWFLAQTEELVRIATQVQEQGIEALHKKRLHYLKRKGFSDRRLATLLGSDEHTIRRLRNELDVHPVYKRVDSCAAEFATTTAYMYSTYEEECEANPSSRNKIMVLGGGPQPHRSGYRVRLLLRPCCARPARGWL